MYLFKIDPRDNLPGDCVFYVEAENTNKAAEKAARILTNYSLCEAVPSSDTDKSEFLCRSRGFHVGRHFHVYNAFPA